MQTHTWWLNVCVTVLIFFFAAYMLGVTSKELLLDLNFSFLFCCFMGEEHTLCSTRCHSVWQNFKTFFFKVAYSFTNIISTSVFVSS